MFSCAVSLLGICCCVELTVLTFPRDKIILGSIVTRCPSMSLAPSALVQLDSACELFSKAASGFRATKVLVNIIEFFTLNPEILTHTPVENYA